MGYMKTTGRLIFFSVFSIGLLLGAPTWGRSADEARMIAGAKKEGKLVWYTSMAIDTSKPMLEAFMKRYPFIKVQFIRTGSAQLINRVTTETLTGKWLFDVVSTSAVEVLAKKNILVRYNSPERKVFDAAFKDANGLWTGVYNNNLVLTYNTALVSEKEVPKDYDDLLDPKWKGKILMDTADYNWYGTLVNVWGKEKADRYMKRLARQDPQFRRGHALIGQLIAAGATPLGWAYNFRVERMKKDGAPVEWVDSFNPIMVTLNGMGLSRKATNPNSAKLFINFVLSKKGQEMVRGMSRIPSRSDVKPLVARMDQSKLKLKAVPKDVYYHLDKYAKDYRKVFGF